MKHILRPIGFFCLLFGMTILTTSTISAQPNDRLTNPILAGFYPDPSICRVGDDYYEVNSTFSYFPGITVFHSKDLVHWNLIGYVLDRTEQLNLEGQGVSRGLFAPAIRFHDGLFYVTCTLVDIGGNFIVTAKNPAGPWSNPSWLPEINGIDPSPFFDDDGKAYITYNSIPPDDKSLYQGHRTIRMRALDLKTLKVTGPEQMLVNGGTDISKKPVWIEAPHLLKKDGHYYLIAAEGGTAEDHSEVVFKSDKIDGPYIPYEHNPILTQRNLDPARLFPVTCAGHADFVQTQTGEWWAVFLGCRPYEGDYYNTGRETFLAPVAWNEGWPIINPGKQTVQYRDAAPRSLPKDSARIPHSGNFVCRDEFETGVLSIDWQFLRTPHERWYDLSSHAGFLAMQLRPEACTGTSNPSFLGFRQAHATGSASTALSFSPAAENEKAGLLIFQNERRFYWLCKSIKGSTPVLELFAGSDSSNGYDHMQLLASTELMNMQRGQPVYLKIEAHGNTYAFLYAMQPGQWNILQDNVDATSLSTKGAGGFVGCLYGLYASSLGKSATTTAWYDWFEYRGDDQVYR